MRLVGKSGRLSDRGLLEDAYHEAGHAVVCANVGAHLVRVKLYPRGRKLLYGIAHGLTICKTDDAQERIKFLLAGYWAQVRLSPGFEAQKWGLDADYSNRFEIQGREYDMKQVQELLGTLDPPSPMWHLDRLTKETQKLIDANWPAIKDVANALLKQKHHALGGKMVSTICSARPSTRG